MEKSWPLHWHVVAAPLTGIFYTRPAPDEEPYVQPGRHVEPEDVVGLVETMKKYNDPRAPLPAGLDHLSEREALRPHQPPVAPAPRPLRQTEEGVRGGHVAGEAVHGRPQAAAAF